MFYNIINFVCTACLRFLKYKISSPKDISPQHKFLVNYYDSAENNWVVKKHMFSGLGLEVIEGIVCIAGYFPTVATAVLKDFTNVHKLLGVGRLMSVNITILFHSSISPAAFFSLLLLICESVHFLRLHLQI